MDQTAESTKDTESAQEPEKPSTRAPRKRMQRTRSFTDALREKYCSQGESDNECDFIINIMIRHKPRTSDENSAELAYLRNVVLNNRRVSTGGLPPMGLTTLCPNVSDLDLSSNLLESWAELLPILSQLPNLTFLNLSRNHLTRHKEELRRWGTPIPRVENVVLNSTGIPLREVIALARIMPSLRELHICCNYYRDLGSIELAIQDGALSKLECLRLNENIITSWTEVWKLRNLPCLTQLILSENPLCDVFYDPSWHPHDELEVDSPNVTCHSDGEDSSYGSPCFRFSTRVTRKPHLTTSHAQSNNNSNNQLNNRAQCQRMSGGWGQSDQGEGGNEGKQRGEGQTSQGGSDREQRGMADRACRQLLFSHDDGRGTMDDTRDNEKDSLSSVSMLQSHVVSELVKDLVSNALQRISVQESRARQGEAEQDVRDRCHYDNAHLLTHRPRLSSAGFVDLDLSLEDTGNVGVDDDNINTQSCPISHLTSTPIKNSRSNTETAHSQFVLGDEMGLAEDESETSMDVGIEEDASCDPGDNSRTAEEDQSGVPFSKLHTLCLSRTSISDLDHLDALNHFPQLRSLKVMDTDVFPGVTKEDRRKLFVASLPHVKILNGSEVTVTERDKAERHFLRHFMDHDDKPARYYELESKHGPVTPLLDIDLGKRFQKEATLTFFLNGEEVFTDTVNLLQPVGKLRSLVAQTMAIPRRSFRMYHYACGPGQSANEGAFDELCFESLPLSRFDFMDGDEIHLEFIEEPNANAVVHFSKKEIKF